MPTKLLNMYKQSHALLNYQHANDMSVVATHPVQHPTVYHDPIIVICKEKCKEIIINKNTKKKKQFVLYIKMMTQTTIC